MGIKETPINLRTYYKTMKDSIRPKLEEAIDKYEKSLVEEKVLYSEVLMQANTYKEIYKFKIMDYEEFKENQYIDGTFHNHAKGLFVNKKHNYKATTILYKLYKLAKAQKELYDLKHQINIWEHMLGVNYKEYTAILDAFYNEVHKKIIIEGLGYVLEQPLGWICINRCKIVQGSRKILDYQATKRKKEQLLAEGKRLFDKEEAKYAASVGKEYDGVDYRVYKNDEVCYEVPLINNRIQAEDKLRLEVATRQRCTVGRTEEEILKECNYDVEKICELPADIKYKLRLCLKCDDLLYLNFIRNEGQQSFKTPKANRKS